VIPRRTAAGIWFLALATTASVACLGLLPGGVGWVVVMFSTIVGLSFNLWTPLIRRAIVFYIVGVLVRVPMFVLYLMTGIALVGAILAPVSARWLYAGFVAGLAILPSAIIRRQTSIRQSMEKGHLRQSLNRAEAGWDPKRPVRIPPTSLVARWNEGAVPDRELRRLHVGGASAVRILPG
jgi:hypothetical protein